MKCCHGQFTSVPDAGGDVHFEGGFWDMLVVEFYGDQVLAGLCYDVLHTTRPILTVVKVQLSFRGSLHSNRQTPSSSLPGVDVELTYKCKGFFLYSQNQNNQKQENK